MTILSNFKSAIKNMNHLTTIAQTIVLSGFFYYLVKGLKDRISALQGVIDAQKSTLDVMERRVLETEKIGNIYRDLLSNLPKDIANFKTIVSQTKDETIVELQSQNGVAKKKLEEAEKKLGNSGKTQEVIATHLKILHNLLKPTKQRGDDRKTELVALCEFDGRKLEDSVSLVLKCQTFEMFVAQLGLSLHIDEAQEVSKHVMRDGVSPKGEPVRASLSGWSVTGGWYCLVNDELYLDNDRLNLLKNEFSSAKTLV